MRRFFNKSFWIYDTEVTVREIILSAAIVFVFLTIGLFISNKLNVSRLDAERRYNTALKIEDENLFTYGMKTNVGDAFVYGPYKAVDTVSYPDIKGEYMYVEKIKEKYTRHTRQVAHTRTVNGKTSTYYTTETYWTWDRVDSETIHSKKIQFLNNVFDYGIIELPIEHYIDTVKESSHIRYVYYGVDKEHIGTIFTDLRDNTISECKFYKNMNIEQTVEHLKSINWSILFWIFWVILIIAAVWGFVYLDNKWLE